MKRVKQYIALLWCGLCILALGGCGLPSEKDHQGSPAASQENSGHLVIVTTYNSENQLEEEKFSAPPKRVIAVWQGPIETLIALGVGDRIIAGTGIPDRDYVKQEYRTGYDAIPYTSFNTITREEALLKHPDFIVTSWGSAFSKKSLGTTSYWQSRGVRTYIEEIPPAIGGNRTVEHEYKFILDMGKIFHVEDRAEAIVNGMKSDIYHVQKKAQAEGRQPTVMIVQYMGNRLVNWGDEYLQADIVKKLNGKLVLHEKGYISKEELIANDPDVIFLMVNEWDNHHEEDILNRFEEDIAMNSLRAIQKQRVYLLPLNEGQYSAVRTKDGIQRIAKGLYPDLDLEI